MKNYIRRFMVYCPSILFFGIAISTTLLFLITADQAKTWLIFTAEPTPALSIFTWCALLVWQLIGISVFVIPFSFFCFGITSLYGMRIRYEQYCGALLLCLSSALITGLYGLNVIVAAPGGCFGVYGALWLRTILGTVCARLCIWFLWMSCLFVVGYDLLLLVGHICYRAGVAVYGWYQRYRITEIYTAPEDSPLPLVQSCTPVEPVSDYAEIPCDGEQDLLLEDEALLRDASVTEEIIPVGYQKPNLGLFVLQKDNSAQEKLTRELQDKAHLLTEKLERFGVSGTVVAIKRGPVVTLYEYQPEIDTKISKIIALEDDLALALQALSIRIIAPIPGRSVVGFEVANTERQAVTMASLVHTDLYLKTTAQLPLILGVDTTGDAVVVDLARMPHLLIAGSTGSGKSVALNTILISLLCSRTPDECRLILIDPKRIEFSVYADIGHLLFPIVTDARTASLVLKWVVKHMEDRYALLAQHGVRSSKEFNMRVQAGSIQEACMPSLVVVIDELADLMMTAGRDVEESIARIAQMARAAGIHLVVATQRPSVDVITGLIKVNFPSRIAFRVASRIDSRTILDAGGADKLLGKGDMLFLDGSSAHVRRLHGAYVSDDEIYEVITQIKRAGKPQYKDLNAELATIPTASTESQDGLYAEVVSFLQEIDEISISLLQRRFRIGYNRSARLIELLEQQGLIMPPDGARPRKVVR